MDGLTIGQVARRAGVGVETVRFYERKGLIEQPPKPKEGYRRYGEAVVSEIRFIKRAQALGFTLARIEVLMTLRLTEDGACGEVKTRAEETLAEIEEKLEALSTFRDALEKLIGACEGTVGEPSRRCALIETLEQEEATP